MQYANERNARAAVASEDGRMIVGQVLGEAEEGGNGEKNISIITIFNCLVGSGGWVFSRLLSQHADYDSAAEIQIHT